MTKKRENTNPKIILVIPNETELDENEKIKIEKNWKALNWMAGNDNRKYVFVWNERNITKFIILMEQ